MQDQTKVGRISLAIGLLVGLVTMRLFVAISSYFMEHHAPVRAEETQVVCLVIIAICLFLRGIWMFVGLVALWLLTTAAHFLRNAPVGQEELVCVLVLWNGIFVRGMWLLVQRRIRADCGEGEGEQSKSLTAFAEQRFELGALLGLLQFVPGWIERGLQGEVPLEPVLLAPVVLLVACFSRGKNSREEASTTPTTNQENTENPGQPLLAVAV